MTAYESFFEEMFLKILKLIDYSYSEMLKDDVEFHLNENGRDSLNNMPLENSITNRLVDYIRNNKKNYNLQLLAFEVEPGSDFSEEYATEGFIDIKVSNITLNLYNCADENIYFAFECKRVNKSPQKISMYVDKGINRFKINKYSKNVHLSGMIGYSEEKYTEIPSIVKKINYKLKADKLEVETLNKKKNITHDYCYVSTHSRKNSNKITLYHLFYDFSDMIKHIN